MHQTKRWLVILAVTLIGTQAAPAKAQPPQSPLRTIAVGRRPESVIKGWGGKVYVSIQGEAAGGADGEIRVLDVDAGTVSPFVAGLENPRGLAFTGKYLVVTDTLVVWIIDRNGNKRILAAPAAFPHPIAFLNDAAAEAGGRAVYVTEMGARGQIRDPAGFLWPIASPEAWAIPAISRVYRISLDGAVTEVVSPSRKVLIMNGVCKANDDGRLLIGEFFHGNIVEVSLKSNRKRIIATGFRGADGIEQDRDGNIYVSSFEDGAVWKMDADGENLQVLIDGVGRQSTADFYLDEKAGVLLVPDTAHGTVIVLPTQ